MHGYFFVWPVEPDHLLIYLFLFVFIIAYPAKFVNPKILKNFKKDCQLDNPQKSVIIGKGISANGPAQRAPITLQGEKRGWLAVYVTLNELLVLLALLVQVAMFVWTIANDINNKK